MIVEDSQEGVNLLFLEVPPGTLEPRVLVAGVCPLRLYAVLMDLTLGPLQVGAWSWLFSFLGM